MPRWPHYVQVAARAELARIEEEARAARYGSGGSGPDSLPQEAQDRPAVPDGGPTRPRKKKPPKATKRVRETVGVHGSLHRRILDLCEALGLVLVDVESFEDMTGLALLLDDGEHVLTTITIRDSLRPEEWDRR